MTLYPIVVSIHVVTAIFGLGQAAAMAVLASISARQTLANPSERGAGLPASPDDGIAWTTLERCGRTMAVSLAVMLLSGALLEYTSGGAFHRAWWFRLSFGLLVALGFVNARMRRALRRRGAVGERKTLEGVVRSSWITCGITAMAAVLMEVKPW